MTFERIEQEQWFKTWACAPHGGRPPFFWGSRELLIKIFVNYFYILYFVYGTTCRIQNNRITWQNDSLLFRLKLF